MKKTVVSIILLNLLAACASQQPKAPVEEAPVTKAAPAPAPAPVTTAHAPVAQAEVDPLNDPASILAKRSVYYPFDVAVVQDNDKPVVQIGRAHV